MKNKVVLIIAILSTIGFALLLAERFTGLSLTNAIVKPNISSLKILNAQAATKGGYDDYYRDYIDNVVVKVENTSSTSVKKFNANILIYVVDENSSDTTNLIYNEKHTFYPNATKGEIKNCTIYLSKRLENTRATAVKVQVNPLEIIE